MELIPACEFSIEELTTLYNQTRVDYLIPMPMNAARLAEYVRVYDVSLPHSLVAREEGEVLGLAMLGVRKARTWITRLGVLPTTRSHGTGQALMEGLLERTTQLGYQFSMLEVIKNNTPAHMLFLKMRFKEIGELLVLRRSPTLPPPDPVIADAQPLESIEALDLVARNRGTQPWTNQSESLNNARDVSGLRVTLVDGSHGWLVYQRQRFTLTRFAYKTEAGDPVKVALAFLSHLHHMYPRLDTHLENIQVSDPHLPAFTQMGYVESFRRIEMWWGTPPASLLAR